MQLSIVYATDIRRSVNLQCQLPHWSIHPAMGAAARYTPGACLSGSFALQCPVQPGQHVVSAHSLASLLAYKQRQDDLLWAVWPVQGTQLCSSIWFVTMALVWESQRSTSGSARRPNEAVEWVLFRFPGEHLVACRRDMELIATQIPEIQGKVVEKGHVLLSNTRLIFVSHSFRHGFTALDLPLVWIFDDSLDMPVCSKYSLCRTYDASFPPNAFCGILCCRVIQLMEEYIMCACESHHVL